MADFEEQLRGAMRARDREAPTVAQFQASRDLVGQPPRRHRGPWVVAGAAAVCVLVVAAVAALSVRLADNHSANSPTPVSAPVLTCPSAAGPGPGSGSGPRGYTYVIPQLPKDPNQRVGRLVPLVEPTHVVVCAYQHSDSRVAVGSRQLTGDFTAIPATLGWLPHQVSEHRPPCPNPSAAELPDDFLVGLSYPDGPVWLSAPGSACAGTADNAQFETRYSIYPIANDALKTGRWGTPEPRTSHGCPVLSGRLGQESTLVPNDPVSVQVCMLAAGASPGRVGAVTTGAASNHLADALNALPQSRWNFGRTCPAGAATAYVVLFRYALGPPVQITINPGCTPAVQNGSLQSASAAPVLPAVHALLPH